MKHRGARRRKGSYFGPFASAGAVGRTINTLQKAFLLRTCSDAVFESRTRPCLLYPDQALLGALHGRDRARRLRPARRARRRRSCPARARRCRPSSRAAMEAASDGSISRRAALYRDRLAALSHIQSHQGINPHGVEEADVFAIHQDGGLTSRPGLLLPHRAELGEPRLFSEGRQEPRRGGRAGAFLAQFYDDKPVPRLILVSHDFEERELLATALCEQRRHIASRSPCRSAARSATSSSMRSPMPARRSARELAETSTQATAARGPCRGVRAAEAAAPHRGLRQQPHHGHERGRRDDRRRAGGLFEEPLSQVQHPLRGPDARRRLRHDARGAAPPLRAAPEGGRPARREATAEAARGRSARGPTSC